VNSFMNQHRSILLIICVLVVSNLLTSLYSQNHNPAFTVSNLHIDGSDYVIIPPDADATPVRTGVTMTYRDNDGDGNPDIPTEGSTALGWESGNEINVFEGSAQLNLATHSWGSANQGEKSLGLEAAVGAATGNSQTLQATYTNPDGDTSPIGERGFTLVEFDYDEPPFYAITDPNKAILSIGNNYTSSLAAADGDKSAHVRFIPEDFIESNASSFSMGISSPDNSNGVDVGSVDSSAVNPFKYVARTETLQNKSHDDPVLAAQYIYFDLSYEDKTVYDALNDSGSSFLEVTSRYEFLFYGSRIMLDHSEETAAGNAIDFVIRKYGLSITEVPEYDPDLTGVDGITDFIFGFVTGVRVSRSALQFGERLLASVMIHEESHVNQGASVLYSAGQGQTLYSLWKGSGYLILLSQSQVSQIYLLCAVEQEAILDQQESYIYNDHMSQSERNAVDSYWDKWETIKNELEQNGYTQ